MIVLIDAGNTRVKAGWVNARTGERETDPIALTHDNLDQLSHWLGKLPATPVKALGVNVAGDVVAAAIEDVFHLHDCPIEWVKGQEEALNVTNTYDNPVQLGPDRWLSMLGLAHRPHPQISENVGEISQGVFPPIILASFGTATTIDTLVVDVARSAPNSIRYTFKGGTILPGPALMKTSLAEGTANLPEAHSEPTAYPTHTHQAISTGVAAAQAGAVLRQWLIGLEYYGHGPLVYSAGGAWPLVKEETRRLLHFTQQQLGQPQTPIEWLGTPVLDGLSALALQSSATCT